MRLAKEMGLFRLPIDPKLLLFFVMLFTLPWFQINAATMLFMYFISIWIKEICLIQ